MSKEARATCRRAPVEKQAESGRSRTAFIAMARSILGPFSRHRDQRGMWKQGLRQRSLTTTTEPPLPAKEALF
jgi:hypothetical protein